MKKSIPNHIISAITEYEEAKEASIMAEAVLVDSKNTLLFMLTDDKDSLAFALANKLLLIDYKAVHRHCSRDLG